MAEIRLHLLDTSRNRKQGHDFLMDFSAAAILILLIFNHVSARIIGFVSSERIDFVLESFNLDVNFPEICMFLRNFDSIFEDFPIEIFVFPPRASW